MLFSIKKITLKNKTIMKFEWGTTSKVFFEGTLQECENWAVNQVSNGWVLQAGILSNPDTFKVLSLVLNSDSSKMDDLEKLNLVRDAIFAAIAQNGDIAPNERGLSLAFAFDLLGEMQKKNSTIHLFEF